jgi:hypothetical protein
MHSTMGVFMGNLRELDDGNYTLGISGFVVWGLMSILSDIRIWIVTSRLLT